MTRAVTIVVFELDGHRFGLHAAAVDRVIHAVEITDLPEAPDIVMGVIDVEGRIIPVVNARRRFHLPPRAIDVDDQFILAHTSRREIALPVDAVTGVLLCQPGEVEPSREIFPGLAYVEGVVRRDDGLILIHDLEGFLSLHEEEALAGVGRT